MSKLRSRRVPLQSRALPTDVQPQLACGTTGTLLAVGDDCSRRLPPIAETAMTKTFSPVSIGTRGRRAIAWFVNNGLVVSATDMDVAAHAMAVVMDGLLKIGR